MGKKAPGARGARAVATPDRDIAVAFLAAVVDVLPASRPTGGPPAASVLGRAPSERMDERSASEDRSHAGEDAARLLRITAAIADAVTTAEVHAALVDAVAAALGASSAGLWRVEPRARVARLVHSVGYSTTARPHIASLPLEGEDRRMPASDAIRAAAPVWLASQAELLERYPHLRAVTTAGRSYGVAALPLVVQGRVLGSLGLTFEGAPPLDDDERRFLLVVARYGSQALERLELLESERRLVAEARAFAARAALLGRASAALVDARADVAAQLDDVARALSEEFADACAVALADPRTGILDLVALHHRDPAGTELIRRLLAASPVRVGQGLLGGVAATGEPILVRRVEDDQLAVLIRPEHREWLTRRPPRSIAMAPLRAAGRVLGTMSAVREEGSPSFEPEDLELLQAIADRAAAGLEARRLHEETARARVRAELLHRLAGAANSADSTDAVFEAALDAIEVALGARRAAILAFDGEGVMRFRAHRGLSERYRSAVEGHSPWARDAENPSPIVVPDVARDPSLASFGALFEEEKIAALAFVPLTAEHRLLGKFMVYHDAPRDMAEDELELARAIASHVAVAIARFAARAELEDALRFSETFTGILGHDLRNPLAAIMAAAQLIRIRTASAAPIEQLAVPTARILQSGSRMARMIDQILDFTRVRVGSGLPIHAASCDLAALVREVASELEVPDAPPRVAIDATGDPHGTWDADRLSQVFSNLIANAFSHGEAEGAVTVRIDGSDPEIVRATVHNRGRIPPALIDHLFEPMTGGDRRRDGSRGLGLGLYITREAVRAHGGAVDVRSTEAEGTTFVVSLPRHTTRSSRCASQGKGSEGPR